MKPYKHAESSAKKWGGTVDDYLPIHNWFDATKASCGDNRHRCLRHHSEGIFWCEDKFGVNIVNSDHKLVSVRDIGEQHLIEDLGFIPTISDYLCELNIRDWMCGDKKDHPESRKFIHKKTLPLPFIREEPVLPELDIPVFDDPPRRPTFPNNLIVD